MHHFLKAARADGEEVTVATQNLVSATLPNETREKILALVSEIRKNLDFLVTLKPKQVRGLVKGGNAYSAFVEKALNVVNEHPEIMPSLFDLEEFRKDFELCKALMTVVDAVRQLCDTLIDTQLAAHSDAIGEALEVYAAVKQNRSRLPGLNAIFDEMSAFFKKARKAARTVKLVA